MIRITQIAFLCMVSIGLPEMTGLSQAQTVATLFRQCEVYEKDATIAVDATRFNRTETGVCLGYFMAIKGMTLAEDTDGTPILNACAPKASTADQLVRIFMKFARENPEKHHEDAVFNVWNSLIRAFPCRKKP